MRTNQQKKKWKRNKEEDDIKCGKVKRHEKMEKENENHDSQL